MTGALFLVNPAAGSGRAGETWRDLRAGRPDLQGADVVLETDVAMARSRLLASIGRRSPERLVVVGGDGSVRLAVDALLAAGHENPPVLGVVPAGTGSDLATSLRLPREPADALRRALDGSPSPLDVLAIREGDTLRFAVNVVSAGISGRVNEIVGAAARRHAATYLTASLRALARYRPVACRVESGEETVFEGELLLLAAANAPTFGRGMRIAPEARWDDGLLDLIVVPRLPPWEVPLRFAQLYRGTHLRSPRILRRRVPSVRFTPLEPFPPLDLDGDPVPSGEVRIEVLPGAMRIVGGELS